MIILVLNCGSSSLKYQLLDMKNDEVYDLLAKGIVERIGMEIGCIKHQATGKEAFVKEMPIAHKCSLLISSIVRLRPWPAEA